MAAKNVIVKLAFDLKHILPKLTNGKKITFSSEKRRRIYMKGSNTRAKIAQICGENRLKIDIFATNLINEFDLPANLKLEGCSNYDFCGESFLLANLTDLYSYVYFILNRTFKSVLMSFFLLYQFPF